MDSEDDTLNTAMSILYDNKYLTDEHLYNYIFVDKIYMQINWTKGKKTKRAMPFQSWIICNQCIYCHSSAPFCPSIFTGPVQRTMTVHIYLCIYKFHISF